MPNLSSLAKQHYDLVIAVGFLMTNAVDTVAQKFPQTRFAIIDVDQQFLPHKPQNVEGLLFREQQGGYLIGYLAELVVKQHVAAPGGSAGGAPVVGVVGGQSIPPVNRFAAGYEAGAKAADPGITVKLDYSQDFVDQGKCKEIALNQSPPAPRSSSRTRARAASARSTPRARSTPGGSAATPTRPTSAGTSSRAS